MGKAEGFAALGAGLSQVGRDLFNLSDRDFRKQLLEIQKAKTPEEKALIESQILKNQAMAGMYGAKSRGGNGSKGKKDGGPGDGFLDPSTASQKDMMAMVKYREIMNDPKRSNAERNRAKRMYQGLSTKVFNPNLKETTRGFTGETAGSVFDIGEELPEYWPTTPLNFSGGTQQTMPQVNTAPATPPAKKVIPTAGANTKTKSSGSILSKIKAARSGGQ